MKIIINPLKDKRIVKLSNNINKEMLLIKKDDIQPYAKSGAPQTFGINNTGENIAQLPIYVKKKEPNIPKISENNDLTF